MPRCADFTCGRWRPERLAPRWAAGIRYNGHWYCSRECVEHAARIGLDEPAIPSASPGSLPPLKIGVLLRHLGVLSEVNLEKALESQRVTGRRLGAELQALGLVTFEPVLKALAAQGGISYLASFDVSRVTHGPSWLPAETVRALGLVPFDVDEAKKRVRVICSAPVPKTAMRALLKLTGWTAEPYLVEDELWQQALRVYRPAAEASANVYREAVAVNGVDDAVARIADNALLDRAVTVRHASCDRYTWVRVEGPRQVSDLLFPAAQEAECQVEHLAR
jgi:hypothetical protein